MKKTQVLVYVSLLISLEIILTRFLSFQTPLVRISFGFLPIMLSAYMFGPLIGGITGALSDIIGIFMFSTASFFPGFTLSAFLTGFIYGNILHNSKYSIKKIIISVLLISLIVEFGLNTIWLSIITGKAITAILPLRIIKIAIIIPIQIISINIVLKSLSRYLEKYIAIER
ncbi:ECF transporter S component, folate family [Caloramator quimbayensis]|uniref:ECF transporter S component, folate family n=1 Tax=Caloramator quimbayensis TaxID=1147123 RepID=A0A1T4YHC9_9CLOT|nr:folate family ECF transporter S component [Caloramator quimbayensis]SKB01242.1 ECF transporter S component, folate family [Caloramator quimbayensis]